MTLTPKLNRDANHSDPVIVISNYSCNVTSLQCKIYISIGLKIERLQDYFKGAIILCIKKMQHSITTLDTEYRIFVAMQLQSVGVMTS
jgi:hypothetical protein